MSDTQKGAPPGPGGAPVALSLTAGACLLLARLNGRAVADPFHQDRVLTVMAVLHRDFDRPAEAGITLPK